MDKSLRELMRGQRRTRGHPQVVTTSGEKQERIGLACLQYTPVSATPADPKKLRKWRPSFAARSRRGPTAPRTNTPHTLDGGPSESPNRCPNHMLGPQTVCQRQRPSHAAQRRWVVIDDADADQKLSQGTDRIRARNRGRSRGIGERVALHGVAPSARPLVRYDFHVT